MGPKVAIVDGMAEVQCLEIAEHVKTCSSLAHKFITGLEKGFGHYN